MRVYKVMLEAYLDFLQAFTADEFIRLFWFFFILELPRYVVLDYLILGYRALKRPKLDEAYEQARHRLWLEQPLVSVIVPGKNEGKNYYQLARTLREQTYLNYEIIIVDDGSDDDSFLIGRDLERCGIIDRFISNPIRGGKASGANLALRYARGTYILHLDADCSLNRDAMERMIIPFYLNPEIGAVGGALAVRNADASICTTLQGIEYHVAITMGRLVSGTLGILRIISGAFGAFRRDILDQVGGWDIGPGLDGDITVKIRKAGYRIHFDAHALALTDVPVTFKKLAKQRLRWQRSLIRFRLRKHFDVFWAHKGFSLLNFLSFAENIFYNLVLNVLWYIYMYDVVTNFTPYLGAIIVTNILLYSAAKCVQFDAFLLFSRQWRDHLGLIPYLPLMSFYTGYFLRAVRTTSYFSEFFFKASYKDPWNPEKTSKMALKHGM